MKTTALVRFAALAALFASFAATAVERPEDRWNLADLYPDVAAWKADAVRLGEEITTFGAFRGKLEHTKTTLRECLDLYATMQKRANRLVVYALTLYSEDTGNASSLELKQKSDVLVSNLGEATAFLNPEILRLGRAKVNARLAQDKGLAIYRHTLDDILRMAPHTLDAKGEAIVATFGLSQGSASSTYLTFANADMPWPTVKLASGEEAKLDQSAYERYRQAANRDDRKKVFDAFWGTWKSFERTSGVLLYNSLKEDTVYTKVRRYKDTLERALDRDRLPPAVYDTLIAQTNANLPTLHRYFKLRARMLGIQDGMRYYDIYPPLVSGGGKYPLEDGKRLILGSVKPLGPEYVAAMAKGLESRWMDAYPRPRKESGAYMAGSAYDVHPYVLQNYNDDYESVTGMAHEWGHAMHSHFSNRAQPYITSDYATFIAEIASTCNEVLLLDHVQKNAKSDDERLLYLGSALENLRATFFRQAMFAEFEREVHARVDRGESLTGETFTKIYGDILRRYHGDKEGVVKIDDPYTVEWAYIPHFYRTFYVFQYATSIAASSLFADAILKAEPGARERYLKLISAGSSDYPYELVKAAGVDLATPAPYQSLVARMNGIMDEIEAILARRKSS